MTVGRVWSDCCMECDCWESMKCDRWESVV